MMHCCNGTCPMYDAENGECCATDGPRVSVKPDAECFFDAYERDNPFVPPKPTNADRMRGMTDEELHKFLLDFEAGDIDYAKTFDLLKIRVLERQTEYCADLDNLFFALHVFREDGVSFGTCNHIVGLDIFRPWRSVPLKNVFSVFTNEPRKLYLVVKIRINIRPYKQCGCIWPYVLASQLCHRPGGAVQKRFDLTGREVGHIRLGAVIVTLV